MDSGIPAGALPVPPPEANKTSRSAGQTELFIGG
jgi:hypothetical protein